MLTATAVGVISDGPSFRDRLTSVLAADDLAVTGWAAVPEELTVEADGPGIDVVVLGGGLERSVQPTDVEALRGTIGPEVGVVAVVRAGDRQLIRRLLKAEVDGLVLDDALEATLLQTLRAVRCGLVVVPRALRRQAQRPTLSTREKQILAMVVMGFTNQEIAAKLFVTESTVKSHLSSAFGKLGVSSRYEAAALITDPESSLGHGILHISGEGRASNGRAASR